MTTPAEQIAQLEQAIAGLESQRAALGDTLINTALAPLRQQLAELQKIGEPAAPTSPSPALEGERKLVTIMFADISGFTALSEQMDPEQVRSLMNACFDTLVPAVHKYAGTVDKFIGDEIMALFGAPIAHENDPERALRAALEMMGRLQEFNNFHHTKLGLHFGINTGLVIAGGIGAQNQQQYSVMGDAVNLASRLEDASERGEIFVGPDTHRLTAPLFEFEALEPMRIKGKAERVPVFRLLRARPQPSRVRGVAGLHSPLVGRAAELATLVEASERARTRQGGAILLTGEAGLGKSRLIAEWQAVTPTLRWAEGHCLSYGQGLAYHLLIDLLHSLLGTTAATSSNDSLQALQALTADMPPDRALEVWPYLGHLLSLPLSGHAQQRVHGLDAQTLQAQYLAAWRQLLLALADQGPLILILEDIHWADPTSLEVLAKLMPVTREAGVLFCALTRPDTDAPSWDWAAAVREQLGGRFSDITLHPLSETASQELVANLLEVGALPDSLRASILRKAEGNPFFVEEVIRMLMERGSLVKQDERWVAVKDIEHVDIPDNIQGLLMARIDRLPEEVKRTLRVASVIGRQFSIALLDYVLTH